MSALVAPEPSRVYICPGSVKDILDLVEDAYLIAELRL
jgi:hypothetical protein